jgi:glycosyltransferase involved in cell wall biosynthesis
MAQVSQTVTIVIPAHNEEFALARLLPALLGSAGAGEFRVIVVCNGCSDGSATVARGWEPAVEVLELAVSSKPAALDAGGTLATSFPIVFLDADVSIDTAGIRALAARLTDTGVLATAPALRLNRDGVSVVAGWYYDVWERLPQVRTGLFGRGVIALSESGYRRISALPHFLSDDLAVSESFRTDERAVVPSALVTVWPARHWRALIRRRIRVTRGNRQLAHTGRVSASASTRPADLWRILLGEPSMALRMPVFLGTAVIARLLERSGRFSANSWLRDETSRA